MPQGSVINTTVLLGKLIEHNISTGAYKKYYLFNGKLLALREGLGSGSTYRYLVTDHLGSLNTTLNLDGTVYSDLRYTPFGKERWAINTSPTGARFTAQRLDTLLDLYNYNARYYDPAIGRFISADTFIPDPTNPQNFNRFAYVLNNPIIHTDPTGHETLEFNTTPEELDYFIQAIDLLFLEYDSTSLFELLLEQFGPVILSGLAGYALAEGIGAFLVGAGIIGAATLATLSVPISLVAGIIASIAIGFAYAWNSAAYENGLVTLDTFKSLLLHAKEQYSPGNTIFISVNSGEFFDTSSLYIEVRHDEVLNGIETRGIPHYQGWLDTGMMDRSGELFIDLVIDYAEMSRDKDDPIYYSTGFFIDTYAISQWGWHNTSVPGYQGSNPCYIRSSQC